MIENALLEREKD